MSIHDLGKLAFLERWNFSRFQKEANAQFPESIDSATLKDCFNERDRLLPMVPTQKEVDSNAHSHGAVPETLCANYTVGCNGVTDGPIKGRLSLCDNCKETLQP